VATNDHLTANDVMFLVESELGRIRDAVVRDALAHRLVSPISHLRAWDYGPPGQCFECWTVVSDPISDAALVYSVYGFGPASPWGLVILSTPGIGMDCGWYTRLEDAFVESHMASPLRISDLLAPDGKVIASSLSSDDAFARRDLLDAGLPKPHHHVRYRSAPADGIP